MDATHMMLSRVRDVTSKEIEMSSYVYLHRKQQLSYRNGRHAVGTPQHKKGAKAYSTGTDSKRRQGQPSSLEINIHAHETAWIFSTIKNDRYHTIIAATTGCYCHHKDSKSSMGSCCWDFSRSCAVPQHSSRASWFAAPLPSKKNEKPRKQ